MQRTIARFMAILMLLSAFGQVAAQPCAEMHVQAAMDLPSAAQPAMSHAMHGAGDMAMPVDHCADRPSTAMMKAGAHCTDSSAATSDDCGQTCSCCPSLCATVLPPSESAGVSLKRPSIDETYTELASSVEPESVIKPPRSA